MNKLIPFLALIWIFGCQKNEAPDCSIVSPDPNKEFTLNETVNISVNAEDADGSIKEVRLSLNEFGISSLKEFPYNFQLDPSDYGTGIHVIKATAVDDQGAKSSDEIQVKFLLNTPEVLTLSASEIGLRKARLAVRVTSNGGSPVSEAGVYLGTDSLLQESGSKIKMGSGTGDFDLLVDTLLSNRTYYFRAFATNGLGTAFGELDSLKTKGAIPKADFQASPRIITRGEYVRFKDLSENGPDQWEWDFGDGNSSTEQDPVHQYNGSGVFTVRLTVSNSYGSNTETRYNFITVESPAPKVFFSVSQQTIFVDSSIQFSDLSTNNPNSWLWEFGDGSTSMEQNPLYTYNQTGTYNITLTATNEFGSGIATKNSHIQVIDPVLVDDIEGNTYKAVHIGDQVWMVENLAVTTFNDGTSIPIVVGNTDWIQINSAAYCWYDNDSLSFAPLYGALYNMQAVASGKLCPSGWHVPSDEEWKELELHLGIDAGEIDQVEWRGSSEGDQLKANWGWLNEENGSNQSLFSALPGGYRSAVDGDYFTRLQNALFWSSSETTDLESGWFRTLNYSTEKIYRSSVDLNSGYSVRCIRD